MRNGKYELIVAPENYPGMKYRGRYAYEHHVVWWQHRGPIPDGYVVHHKNDDKRDNRLKNLELLLKDEHDRLHSRDRIKPRVELLCPVCHDRFYLREKKYEERIRISKSGTICCSRECADVRRGA